MRRSQITRGIMTPDRPHVQLVWEKCVQVEIFDEATGYYGTRAIGSASRTHMDANVLLAEANPRRRRARGAQGEGM